MGTHNDFGKKGEQLAADYLLKKGYTIRYKNYRHLKAEVDIIAQKGSILAIVEVRSRSTDFIENIADTITKKKIQLQVLAADHYVTDLNLDVDVRFDVITILKNKHTFDLNHIENAYYHF
ncbi:YraN family protein [Maribacter sp.]|uniref:YraN family protein n=1 Tax=Maribacter sp. TaxID=1897614 RepID=UPI0025BF9B6C|nr:YraN family protein [Maribacter sp.]